jgi:uncharacterized protein
VVRALVDTNVLVSALISRFGSSKQIVDAWHAGTFELITAPAVIAEAARALRYDRVMKRYNLSEESVEALLASLWSDASIVGDPVAIEAICADPNDDFLLAICRDSGADYLVTGDRLVREVGVYGRTQIVTPRRFIEVLSEGQP